MLRLSKIISGGQTGADQAALFAAEALGLTTGGWMPRGFRVDDGVAPELAHRFNMLEHSSSAYPSRTKTNVLASDATLIFGQPLSAGSKLTQAFANTAERPLIIVVWTSRNGFMHMRQAQYVEGVRSWLAEHDPVVLNVAGNRERSQPGIFEAAKAFLIETLQPLVHQ